MAQGDALPFHLRMAGSGNPPPFPPMSHIFLSFLGSFIGILVLCLLHYRVALEDDGADWVLIVGSFGAQAVLIFAAPRAPLAQPWNAVIGSLISSIIGVSCWKLVGDPGRGDVPSVAAALAVSLSIAAMMATRSLHPPAGAVALIAVIGSDRVHRLGYLYVFFPAVLSAILHVTIAVIFDNLTSKDTRRHYPVYWFPYGKDKNTGKQFVVANVEGNKGAAAKESGAAAELASVETVAPLADASSNGRAMLSMGKVSVTSV